MKSKASENDTWLDLLLEHRECVTYPFATGFGIWVHSPYRDRELTCLCPNVEDFGSWGGSIHQFHAVESTGRLPPVSGCFTPVRWGMEVVSKHHSSFPLPTFGCYSVVSPLYRRGPGSLPELDIRPHDPSWVGIGP